MLTLTRSRQFTPEAPTDPGGKPAPPSASPPRANPSSATPTWARWPLLAEIPQGASRDNADVAAVAQIAGNPEDMEVLDACCATGSLRRAADLLHLHHSSVARRLEPIAKTLGIELTEPTGLMRARLDPTAWRLLNDRGR
jgi:hypothetical protein